MSPSTLDKPRRRIPLQPNPFASAALQSAWTDVPADVAEIHDAPFRSILLAVRQMRLTAKGTSFVVTGAPGSGKTHLLGRLRNRLDADARNGAGKTVYIYVRCNASAATLWRHVRLSLTSDLLKSGSLDRLLSEHPDDLDKVDNLNLSRVLRCIHEGRHTLAASAWLRGESLTETDLAALGVAVENDDEDRSREFEAKRITHALLGYIGTTPTVLCFDQVEGLETYRGEQAGFHVFGQLISELHSRHDRVLFLSCLVADYRPQFEQALNQSDKDRVFQHEANLRPVEWEPASRIVKARLDASPSLAVERRAHPGDPWWPLNPDLLKPLFAATGVCFPRTLIQTCSKQFDQLMGEELPAAPEPAPRKDPADFLQEQYEKRLAEARRAVPREGGDKILAESLPWLLQNSGLAVLGPSVDRSQFANLSYRGPTGITALAFCYRTGNSFTSAVRRISNAWKPPVALKILSDPSIQPKPGSVGAKILGELKKRGAQQIYPLPEALAALHAIRNLTTSALSGELIFDGRQIDEREATAWVLANLAPQVEQFRDELADKPGTDRLLPALSELVSGRKVIEIDAAARELSLQAEEVTACARRHPMHFGLLEGPPLVLFEAVEGPPPEIPDA